MKRWRSALVPVTAVLTLLALAGCAGETGPLAAWRTALDDRDTTAATWVALGDSITEGQGASSRPLRWTELVRDGLAAAHPLDDESTATATYLPAVFGVYAPDSTWGYWATDVTGDVATDFDAPTLGYRSLRLSPGSALTFPVTGTAFDLWWGSADGAFSYSVDGGAPVRVDVAGGEPTANIEEIDGLSAGDHTIRVSAEGTVGIEGITQYSGDRDRGIRLIDSARSGSTLGTFLADEKGFVRSLAAAEPDLVTITLGGNDTRTDDPPTVAANYERLLAGLKGLPSKPSIVVIGEFVPGPAMGDLLRFPWAEYQDAIRDVTTKMGGTFVDLAGELPEADESGTGIYSTDGIHLNDTGQAEVAALVLTALK